MCDNNKKEIIHFLPCYFCKLCNKAYCSKCSYSHLYKNIKNGSHDESSLITKDSIIYDNYNKLKSLKKIKENISFFLYAQKEKVKEEKKRIVYIRTKLKKKFDKLNEILQDLLDHIKYTEKRIIRFIKQKILTNTEKYEFLKKTEKEKLGISFKKLISYESDLIQRNNLIKTKYYDEKNDLFNELI